MKKRVGVLMGGPSCENEVSIKSGRAVCKALKNSGVDFTPVELAKEYSGDYREMALDKIRSANIDIAFIALHGEFGEDGTIQEILEGINMPYTGSRVDASRLGMDKIRSRHIFKSNSIPVPACVVIDKTDIDKPLNARVYSKELRWPFVIKPSMEGSSIGLSIVDKEKDFNAALDKAFDYSDRVLIEEYIRGREITVGILEDKALPVVEVMPKRRFFDFEAKYAKGLTEYRVPAQIDGRVYHECQKKAVLAHRLLKARSFSRVDMILKEDDMPVVLELNTIPGLTELSLLPMAASSAGIGFEKLILKILETALW